MEVMATQGYLGRLDASQIVAQHGQQGAIRAVSEQFEAQFLQTVLKHMRAASDALADEDSPLSSQNDGVYRDLYDGELALSLSGKANTGLVEALTRQLGGQLKSQPDEVAVSQQQPTTAAMQQAVILPFVAKEPR
ncbi:flagellar protein FlgJ [Ferrimonas sediminum]|uniref:Flagellar protein FlgJ n=1 Tax=Ferrimonas sediminum TaxID=718193 RepID=A0A1G8ZYI1_9GAMM|nr:rod-binding protein [Ferrimonas sediminum]SDK20041.1 flagellar protein FlgJ [Ferrimonas sediminum]